MKLTSQEAKDFIKAMTSEQGHALAKHFEQIKYEYALRELKKSEMNEFERGRCAGIIQMLEEFVSEFKSANNDMKDLHGELKQEVRQVKIEEDSIVDFQKVYNKANSLKS